MNNTEYTRQALHNLEGNDRDVLPWSSRHGLSYNALKLDLSPTMDKLAIIGVSQRRGGTDALEAWNRWTQSITSWPTAWVAEMVPILTCNRSELVLALADGVTLEQLIAHMVPEHLSVVTRFQGEKALLQLAKVASSLDSLNPGEDQIMNQVRQAYEQAQNGGTTGSTTAFAFQTALRIAKRVRREIPLAPANTSLFSLAKPELEAKLEAGSRIAILGAGEMGTLAAKSLLDSPYEVCVVNRTYSSAQTLANGLGFKAIEFSEFMAGHYPVHALVSATKAPLIINQGFLSLQPQLHLIVDLGLPRNVDIRAANQADIHVIDLDWLELLGEERRARLQKNLVKAEQVIAMELELAKGDWAERQLSDSVVRLRAHYLNLLNELAGDLIPEARLEGIASRFAHLPVKGLRGLARQKGVDVAEVFLHEAGSDLLGDD